MKITRDTWGMLFLALILLALIGFGLACMYAGKTLEGSSMVVGALIALAKDLTGYFWGSSAGSKEKDELIRQHIQGMQQVQQPAPQPQPQPAPQPEPQPEPENEDTPTP